MIDLMKLPQEPARAIELCAKAGLSERETKIVIAKKYPSTRKVIITKTKPLTFRELGEEHHMTPQGVKFIYDNAIKKLERHVKSLGKDQISVPQ